MKNKRKTNCDYQHMILIPQENSGTTGIRSSSESMDLSYSISRLERKEKICTE
jgi:hypothetical protein